MGSLSKKSMLVSLLASSLAGCLSGSAIVTGSTRTPLDPGQVKVYAEAPAKYEVIGLVTATCDGDWTVQGSQDWAVKELKNQAAKLGANGVVLEPMGGRDKNFGIGKTVSGKAVFVSDGTAAQR
jgi:hypothetical protein